MNSIHLILTLACMALVSTPALADAKAKKTTFSPYSKKAGSTYRKLPKMPKGGTLIVHLGANPEYLNPIVNNDMDTKSIMKLVYMGLLTRDYEGGEYFPGLAEKVSVSLDHKVMTFTLNAKAKWHDGTPVTTADVEFSYQTLWDPKVFAAPHRAYLGKFDFEKVDERVFRLKVENPNVNTLSSLIEEFWIVQKKQFEGVKDFNKSKQIMNPVSSGPYVVKSFSRDQQVVLERNKDWWAYGLPEYKNLHNFDKIIYKIVPDKALAYEKFVKGEIDLIWLDTNTFGTRARGSDRDLVGTSPKTDKKIWAKHFSTKAPANRYYIGWDLKHPLFKSKKTRRALAHLVNYDWIIKELYHDVGARNVSPFGSYSQNSTPQQFKVAIPFDIAKAVKLLKEDGWADTDADNVLDKVIDGKKTKFEFTLRYNSDNQIRAKISQMVKENFKKAGISVNIQSMEWNTFVDEYENHRSEAYVSGWGGGSLLADPKQIWHSKSYEDGSNYIGYSNPEVDALIEKARSELNPKKYLKIIQKIGAIIYDDQPNVFLVEVPGFVLGVNSRIKAKVWAYKTEVRPAVWQYYTEDRTQDRE